MFLAFVNVDRQKILSIYWLDALRRLGVSVLAQERSWTQGKACELRSVNSGIVADFIIIYS